MFTHAFIKILCKNYADISLREYDPPLAVITSQDSVQFIQGTL